jgi:H+/Cl- antiporter ClcA
MFSAPPNTGTKVGTIIYGICVGAVILIAVVLTSVLLGALIAWLFDANGWTGLGEYRPWLPIILGEYSILPGVIVGAIVCWRIWKPRLRPSG